MTALTLQLVLNSIWLLDDGTPEPEPDASDDL